MKTNNKNVVPLLCFPCINWDLLHIPSFFIGNCIHISGTMSLMLLSEQDGIQKGSQRLFLSQNEPARGCMPVRQYHRRDESKILPHVRRGLQLDNL